MSKLASYLALARPRHWVKSAFVLMPVPFAVAAGARADPWHFLLGMAGLAVASSAVYALNDVRDVEQDRLHPRKRLRPVAAGRLSASEAIGFGAALFLVGAGLTALSGSRTALLIVLSYVAINLVYSFGAKHLPLIDVFLLSAGFILRVLLGCALLAVSPSAWLLLCSSTLALFMALTKRQAELDLGGADHRPSLEGYRPVFLHQAIGISAGMTLIAYALYTMEAEVLLPGREFATIPFVIFGVLEYLRLTHVEPRGSSPVDLIYGSPSLLFAGGGWIVATTWSLGLF
jgi:4-hydroxybenzoate polyprenyltransferase